MPIKLVNLESTEHEFWAFADVNKKYNCDSGGLDFMNFECAAFVKTIQELLIF